MGTPFPTLSIWLNNIPMTAPDDIVSSVRKHDILVSNTARTVPFFVRGLAKQCFPSSQGFSIKLECSNRFFKALYTPIIGTAMTG